MLTFAIGDVHGCLAQLEKLMTHCRDYAGDRELRFVMLGDYIDRGPDSAGAIAWLRQLCVERPEAMVCLKGNHEDMLLACFETPPGDLDMWLVNGGFRTLQSYGDEQLSSVPEADIAWMKALPTYFDDGLRYYVHAGIDPTIALDKQVEHIKLWVREPWLSSDSDVGRLVVHGHTPLRKALPDFRRHRLNLDTACVFGGRLTAAVFNDKQRDPLAFITDAGLVTELAAANASEPTS